MKNRDVKSGKVLGMDFGEKSVGLAVSDAEKRMVFGHGAIKGFKSLKELFTKIKLLCEEERVVEIVMGVPLTEDGNESPQSGRIREIGRKLEASLVNIPVKYEDESFSSFEAVGLMREMGVKAKDFKRNEDEIAAVRILERYLRI